jgi:hypothetical protein
VAINGVWACRNGCAGHDGSKADLRPRDETITVDLSAGPQPMVITTSLALKVKGSSVPTVEVTSQTPSADVVIPPI